MLKADQRRIIDDLWGRLNEAERHWLAGYVSGRAQESGGGAALAPLAGAPVLNIFYATETGNAKAAAFQLEKQAKAAGYKTKNAALGKVKPADLSALKDPAVFLASTHGEGDPPEIGKAFFKALSDAADLALPGLRYAVLGLGDKSYKKFCEMGEVLEARFSKAGAQAFHPKTLLDVDYAAHVPGWIDAVLASLAAIAPAASGLTQSAAAYPRAVEPHPGLAGFTRLEPVQGRIKDIVNLNDTDSDKETYHIEVEFDAVLPYAAGDSAGIVLEAAAGGETPVPRLYSIASSPLAFPQEIHLAVARATHANEDGTTGYGLCSDYLSRKHPGDSVVFYIQRNQRFRLPPADGADIIMIGPGTGVAPFRAFMQERVESGSAGRSWMFFGDRRAHCDFLYQVEWQNWLESGALTHLDVAFSRDQPQKIYVQDKMRNSAKALYAWLENGAHLYVCGAKTPMSEDVEAALLEILAAESGKGCDWAQDYLGQMTEDDRYLKDVY